MAAVPVLAQQATGGLVVGNPAPAAPAGGGLVVGAPETPTRADTVDRTQVSDGLEITASVAGRVNAPAADTPLALEVALNGQDTFLVAEFVQQGGTGRISATRSELRELGIRAPATNLGRVYLDEIEGVDYDYDPISQSIAITAPFSALLPKVQSAAQRPEFTKPEQSYGAVLNYALDAQAGPDGSGNYSFTSFTGAVDGWVFTPFGTLSSTGFYRHYPNNPQAGGFIRQETRLDLHNLNRAVTLTLGDVTTSATAWSRPIRMGGVQLRRDFSLRSDLVTEQLFSFEGAAAVPSSVDVYIENNRAYTGQVQPGPFRLEDVPIASGGGDAVVVVRDATGREVTREVSFFTSPNLLKKGRFDFSLETGRAREAYGSESGQYGGTDLYSATLAYGLTRRMTLEAHVEGSDDLLLAGFGIHAATRIGELSFAVGQSDYLGTSAGFAYGTLSTQIGKVDLQVSSLRAEAGFADLAYVTGLEYLGADAISDAGSLLEFPTITDVISVGIPISDDYRNLGLSLVRSERASSRDLIASVAYSHSLDKGGANFSVYGSHNFESEESRFSMALSMPLGKRTTGRAQVSTSSSGERIESLYASRAISDGVGDYGYTARLERQDGRYYGGGSVEYLGRYGKVSGELLYSDGQSYLRGAAEGAVVIAGGQPALGNTISDSFAVVRTGVPDLPVQLHHREVTRTGMGGVALVPGLSSFRLSHVSVDPKKLDDSVVLGATGADVVPSRRGGVLVDFKLEGASGEADASALVTLVSASGAPLPPGSEAKLGGKGAGFPVGYDGLTYVDGLKSQNTLKVELAGGGSCRASFAFTPTGELQPQIGPFTCQ
ncbi:fimbria/pilus outer membrane usher protein [Vannielia litorea]|nr:fimbria/pilus outer membrane usher protein [Vannielia litorea]